MAKKKSKAKKKAKQPTPKKAEMPKKAKSKTWKDSHIYAWFREGKPYFCRIRMVAGTKDKQCVNKPNGCGNCAVVLAYELRFSNYDWDKVKSLNPGNVPKS